MLYFFLFWPKNQKVNFFDFRPKKEKAKYIFEAFYKKLQKTPSQLAVVTELWFAAIMCSASTGIGLEGENDFVRGWILVIFEDFSSKMTIFEGFQKWSFLKNGHF